MDWVEITKILIVPIIIGFISAFFGAKFAFKRYKEEKLWDERQKSYKIVIDAFEELTHWAEQNRASYFCEPYNNTETKYEESLRIISKYVAVGESIFSKEFYQVIVDADNALYRFRFEVNEESAGDRETERACAEWNLVLANGIGGITREHLLKLIQIAKKDSNQNRQISLFGMRNKV